MSKVTEQVEFRLSVVPKSELCSLPLPEDSVEKEESLISTEQQGRTPFQTARMEPPGNTELLLLCCVSCLVVPDSL